MARKKTQQITIPPKLKEWLQQYSDETGVSMSMIITRQLRKLKRREESKKNEQSLAEHPKEFKLYA